MSERADACLAALDDADRRIARRVFLRLIRFGDGGNAGRSQPLSALEAGGDAEPLARVVRQLTDAGLLRPADGDAQVELADEALIAWPALQGWLGAHGKAEQLRRQLETDAAGWRPGGDVALLDRAQLAEVAGWLTDDARRELGVSEAAEAFLVASRAAARRRWWPGRSTTGTVLAILLVLLILATPIILLFIVVITAGVIHRLT